MLLLVIWPGEALIDHNPSRAVPPKPASTSFQPAERTPRDAGSGSDTVVGLAAIPGQRPLPGLKKFQKVDLPAGFWN